MKNVYFIILLSLFLSCNKKSIFGLLKIENNDTYIIKQGYNDIENWYEKDIIFDTIPGISLKRAYDSILPTLGANEKIIVAVIDTEIDTKHEDFKEYIWKNIDEIPDNDKDDDQNGYVDDIHGWNFLGNIDGHNIMFLNTESVRIIRKYNEKFRDKTIDDIHPKDTIDFNTYLKAKEYHKKRISELKSDQEYGDFLYFGYPKAKKTVKEIFNHENYTVEQLDSLYKKLNKTNPNVAADVYFISDFMKYNLTEEWIQDYKSATDSLLIKSNNLDYFDKSKIDKDEFNLDYISYGNPVINENINKLKHGTKIAGLIAANRKNNLGILGVYNNVEIMPIAVSAYGNVHDKDMALAIRYATDNGAKVINLSISKTFSLGKEWVFDAIKYAHKKDVLIISSAGNSNYNLNEFNELYPNDNINNSQEISDNFLLVASSSFKANDSLASFFTNIGNIDVDLFAPGEKIKTCVPNNAYETDDGTSLSAAITSGLAALVRSYYPNLTASQVKHILMDSGVEYTFDVKVGDTLVPFNTLSKSGKILNAYNAMIMADSISRAN